jgi:hypothetical protein
MSELEPLNASFVVRIWWEDTEGAPIWRGRVQNVFTEQMLYFTEWHALTGFLCTACGVSPPSRVPLRDSFIHTQGDT